MSFHHLSEGGEDIRVTNVGDSEDRSAEGLTASSTELVVVATEDVDVSLGHVCIVLNLRTLNRGAVVRNDDNKSATVAKSLEGALGAEAVLTRADSKGKLCCERVEGLLAL